MSDLTMVRTILNGSKRINEMKKEIKSFVSILSGFVNMIKRDPDNTLSDTQLLATKKQSSTETNSNELYWFIEKPKIVGTEITILLKHLLVDRYVQNSIDETPLELVEDVYNSLPTLLEESYKKFPRLREKIAPLIDASRL